jgi:cation transport regulator ChaC
MVPLDELGATGRHERELAGDEVPGSGDERDYGRDPERCQHGVNFVVGRGTWAARSYLSRCSRRVYPSGPLPPTTSRREDTIRVVAHGSTWVFGYGSLVSPASTASTIGRPVEPDGVVVAELSGYGRRWNYGSLHLRGRWEHAGATVEGGVVVALGLVESPAESCNGVVIAVTDDELARLDHRERDYARTDVTASIVTVDRLPEGARVVTYVPSSGAVERYEQARDSGRAAVRRSYWDLVHEAFGALGAGHFDQFCLTPRPDVPIVDVEIRP